MRSGVGLRGSDRSESADGSRDGDQDGEGYVEAIAAEKFDDAAREIFAAKKNLRLVEVIPLEQKWVLKNVSGGVLLQDEQCVR